MTYQVFEADADDGTRLELGLTQLWIISTLEVALRIGDISRMLLTYPSYPLGGQDLPVAHDESYWAPPFLATPVQFGFSPPSTLGSARRHVAHTLETMDVRGDLERLAYSMGLRDVSLSERGAFLEIKASPRTPQLLKGYFVLRHGLVSVDDSCIRSLADSESRRGYVFAPLDMASPEYSRRESREHGRMETWLLGKPMQSNVEFVLNDDGRRSQVQGAAIGVRESEMVRDEEGLAMAADLAQFGAALRYAASHMHTFDHVGADAQRMFRREIAALLQGAVAEIGTTQANFAGDGFMATLPTRVWPDVADSLARIIAAWGKVVDRIDVLSSSLREESRTLGTRIAIHHGKYSFGRMGGLASFSPALDGQTLVEVARMEQGLARLDVEGAGVNHLLALSEPLRQAAEPVLLAAGWTPLGIRELAAKEYSSHANVYGRVRGGGFSAGRAMEL